MEQQQLALALASVREELDDYREAINENTSEVQTTTEIVGQIDKRIDRLAERIDQLFLIVKQLSPQAEELAKEHSFEVQDLSRREKEVFFALYVLGEQQPFVSYRQLARRLLLPENQIPGFVATLIAKGVPMKKKYHQNQAFIALDDAFRQVQAKHNIVHLDTKLSYWTKV